MKKVIRLTESNLVDIVKKVITEQNYSEVQGTTDPTRIAKLSVLTNAGLPADEANFRGRWVLEQPNIYKTFGEVKNLSLFKNQNPKSPADSENYIEVTVQRFLPNVLNPDRTVKVKGGPDLSTPPVVESLTNNGTKTFNVKYKDPDGKHIWSLVQIVASGNGLLALSRALNESTGMPNKITIGMSQTQRTSGGFTYDASKIANTTPTLNSLSNITTAAIINKSDFDASTKKYVSGDMSGIGRYFDKTNEQLADIMAKSLYFFDTQFIPKEQIQTYRTKVDASGKLLLPNYNSAPFLEILNKLPVFTDFQSLFDANTVQQRWDYISVNVTKSYSKFNDMIKNEVVEQYKKRLIAFFTMVYKDANQATQLVNSTQFRSASLTIERSFQNAIVGVKYTSVANLDKATEKKTGASYEVGQSKPSVQK